MANPKKYHISSIPKIKQITEARISAIFRIICAIRSLLQKASVSVRFGGLALFKDFCSVGTIPDSVAPHSAQNGAEGPLLPPHFGQILTLEDAAVFVRCSESAFPH